MSESLRDQLVKAGLASASQARKAERQAKAEKHSQKQPKTGKSGEQGKGSRRPDPNSPAQVKERARKQQAEKRARDKLIAEAANEKAAAKALRAEVKQIIQQNDQRSKTRSDEDVPYNFVHNKKIKRIYVPPVQLDLLSRGKLVIVNNDGLYSLLTAEVAEQIRTRDPKRIITVHEEKAPEPGSDDEFYAKFQVPDDLDW